MSRVTSAVGAYAAALADLVAPLACGGCGSPGERICGACLDGLVGALFVGGPQRVRPDPCPPGLGPIWAAGAYAGVLAALVRAYKDGDRRDLRPYLAPLLTRTIAVATGPARGRDGLVVIVMPSSRAARRARGDVPVADLVRAAAEPLGIPVVESLRMGGRPLDQSRLGAAGRAANLHGRMSVRRADRWQDRPVLLADDVVTTGSSLAEAGRALAEAGARLCGSAILAATPRHLGTEVESAPEKV